MVNIAVLGYGTVGSGVVEVINTNHNSINKRAGAEINIKYVLDLRDFPGDPVEKVLVHDYDVIANDPEVDIVVEVMGGIEPAYTFVKRALESGKSVCTSNKALVAKHGPELMESAGLSWPHLTMPASRNHMIWKFRKRRKNWLRSAASPIFLPKKRIHWKNLPGHLAAILYGNWKKLLTRSSSISIRCLTLRSYPTKVSGSISKTGMPLVLWTKMRSCTELSCISMNFQKNCTKNMDISWN